MNIQINTDKNISGNKKLTEYVTDLITDDLSSFANNITRIEVHLADENGSKPGQDDKRCMLEARLENRQPIAVTSHGNTVEKALSKSLDKLKTSIESMLGRLNRQ